MNYKIHRGSHEIGGSCVEVTTQDSRVVLDLGLPLSLTEAPESYLPPLPALFGEPDGKETAILISHAHQDHSGLAQFADASVPVYLGKVTHELLCLLPLMRGEADPVKNPAYFTSGHPFRVGDIEVTPYLVDHAAPDAYAFLVEGEGKRIFYSGDFRNHGRKSGLFEKLLKHPPQNIDTLLMEGTTVGSVSHENWTEEKLEDVFAENFQASKGLNLVYASSQNIDRLVSVYRACKRAGKIFAVDFYTANVLEILAQNGARVMHAARNPHDFPDLKVFFPPCLVDMVEQKAGTEAKFKYCARFAGKRKITRKEIDENYQNIVMLVRPSSAQILRKLQNMQDAQLFYSLWSGYREDPKTQRFLGELQARGVQVKPLHTSGHADVGALKEFKEAINPRELVPIHTEHPEMFEELFG
jgi:ribonuclease J